MSPRRRGRRAVGLVRRSCRRLRGQRQNSSGVQHARQQAGPRRGRTCSPERPGEAPVAVGVVVVSRRRVGAPGVADGVTGASEPGSPAYGVPAAAAPDGGSTS